MLFPATVVQWRNRNFLERQKITRSNGALHSSPASHGDRRAIRGTSGVGRPRGVLGHARALPRAAGAQGRASLPSLGAATAWRWAPTALLALSVARVHAAPRSTDALVALAMNGIITLACNGSQSNHVLLELAMCAAVLLCAPSVTSGRPASSDGGPIARAPGVLAAADVLHARGAVRPLRHHRLRQAQRRLARPERVVLRPDARGRVERMGLEPITPPSSPRSAFAPSSVRRHRVRTRVPAPVHLRILARGSATWTAAPRDAPTSDGRRRVVPRAHRAPPPPMSVYPFSMIMAPMYVAGMVPHETGACASAFAARWKSGGVSFRAGVWAVVAVAVAVAIRRHEAHSYFEYPPYFAWELGALWVCVRVRRPDLRRALPGSSERRNTNTRGGGLGARTRTRTRERGLDSRGRTGLSRRENSRRLESLGAGCVHLFRLGVDVPRRSYVPELRHVQQPARGGRRQQPLGVPESPPRGHGGRLRSHRRRSRCDVQTRRAGDEHRSPVASDGAG